MHDHKWLCVKCEKYIEEDTWYGVPNVDGEHYTHYHTDCYINRNKPDFINNPEPLLELSDSKQIGEQDAISNA